MEVCDNVSFCNQAVTLVPLYPPCADKALSVDPTSLDVLLSLGVSHTNELDQGEALTYLSRWLQHHPQHRAVAQAAGPPPDSSQAHSHTIRMFEQAATAQPQDAELHMALGVLYHLARQYDGAVRAFRKSLELRPQVRGQQHV